MGIRGDSALVPWRPAFWNDAEVVPVKARAGSSPGHGQRGPGVGSASEGEGVGGGGVEWVVWWVGVPWGGCVKPGHGV